MSVPTDRSATTGGDASDRSLLRRWIVVGAAAGALVGLLLTAGIALRSGDASTLIHFAPPHTDAALAPPDVVVLPETRGYDGQFYYRIAVDPLSTAERVDGVALDHPALRVTRVGYPMFAKLIAVGPPSVVTAMLTVNVIASAAIGIAGVLLARAARRPPWMGLAVLFVPAFVYGSSMSVTDTTAGALVLLGLAALHHERVRLAALAFAVAALTRETTLLVPAVLLATVVFDRVTGSRRDDERARLLVGAVPFAAALVWQAIVVALWGEVGPLSSGGSNLTVPFVGPFVTDGYLSPSTGEEWLNILAPGAVAVVVAMSLIALFRGNARDVDRTVRVALVVAAVVAVSVGPALLETYRNSVRGMGDAVILGVVAALYARGRAAALTLVGVVALGAVLMAWELRIAPDLS